MKKVGYILILVVLFIGCGDLFEPKSITDRNKFYENEEFNIFYPRNWKVNDTKEKIVFSAPRSKRFTIEIRIVYFSDPFFTANFGANPEGFLFGKTKEEMKEKGFISINTVKRDIWVQDHSTIEYVITGKKPDATWEVHFYEVFVSRDKFALIKFSFWDDFSDDVNKRILEVINSIRFK